MDYSDLSTLTRGAQLPSHPESIVESKLLVHGLTDNEICRSGIHEYHRIPMITTVLI